MNFSLKKHQNKILFVAFFLFYLIFKLVFYLQGKVFFDEGIYVGLAKYFVSFGQAGYFETLRPLALPFLLIPFQKLPVNSLFTGRLLSLVLVFFCYLITYQITKKWFGEKAALWSAFLFSTSYTFLSFTGYISNINLT